MAQIPHTLINGQRFVGSLLMTEPHTTSEQVEVRRSWAERLFDMPWRPLKATKLEMKYTTVHKPSRTVYRAGGVYYAHPELIKEMAAAIDKVNERKP